MELDTNKASGPDGTSAQMLKATAAIIAPSLTKLLTFKFQNFFSEYMESC